jgi:hypothetical protein
MTGHLGEKRLSIEQGMKGYFEDYARTRYGFSVRYYLDL